MKRNLIYYVMAFLAIIILGLACRPPEIEGLLVRIKEEMFNEETYQLAEEAVQTHPENAEAWYYYGWLYGRKGDFEKMNTAFDKVLALNPQQSVKAQGTSMPAKEAIDRIRLNYFAENFNAAKSDYDKAREAEDQATKEKFLNSAVEKFTAAHQADPTREEPLQPLAVSYLLLGDTLAAEKQFQRSVEMQPQNDELQVTAGDFYVTINKYDQAEKSYKNAISLNESNENAYLGLGQVETRRGNWDQAAQYFEKALEINPDNTNVAFNIGVSFYNQEKYDKAIPYLVKTIEAEPDNVELHEILGICYVQSKSYDEGMKFLENAVSKFPDNSDLWNYLAIIYANKGMKDKAEEALEKTKELEGNM
jgi:protein O-GlcNAc transferase